MNLQCSFSGEVWYWRGPAPFHFVTVPPAESAAIKAVEKHATYGWGMIPVRATIGNTEFETALWPKDGQYILPLKDKIRKAEQIEVGSAILVAMEVVMTHGSR
ncbi:MAG: DUF1905 domain-containing protein [Fimbriimonadaceae bacterium]|nr:DUF1905 domain-containing protein [Fimbriimonadaceae bacterium]